MRRSAQNTLDADLPAIPSKLAAKLRKKGIRSFDRLSEKEQMLVWEWSRDIIRTYRAILESNPRNFRKVKDLPASKDDIKLAIKIALPLYVSKDLQRMIRVLKNAYKELGAFQPVDSNAKERATAPGHTPKAGKRSSGTSDATTQMIVSEKKALTEEINNFVTDLESLA